MAAASCATSYLGGGGEARKEVSGSVAEGLEAALAIVPGVSIARVGQVLMAQLAFAARVLASALVGRGLAVAEATLVGDLALLAVVARPDAIALRVEVSGSGRFELEGEARWVRMRMEIRRDGE